MDLRLRVSVGLALGLALAGCTARSDFMRPAESPSAIRAPADHAAVVFIRPTSFSAAIKTTILDDKGNFVGDSLPSSSFVAIVDPGEHVFIAWGQNTSALRANLAAGKTYFVEVAHTTGLWSARVDLVPLTPRSDDWARRDEWIHDGRMFTVDRARGQAFFADRKEAVERQIHRARELIKDSSPFVLARISLEPGDGL